MPLVKKKVPAIAVKKIPITQKFPPMSDGMRKLCLPIAQVKPWDKNPRKNDKSAVKLAKLIEQHGWRKPIIIDQNGIIRAGNTAFKAAKILGLTHIPVLREHFSSEAAAIAFGIADNKASEEAAWDDDILRELLSANEVLQDRKVLGFSEGDFSEVMQQEKVADEVDPENYSDAFCVKIDGVLPEDSSALVQLINDAISTGGYEYEARAY